MKEYEDGGPEGLETGRVVETKADRDFEITEIDKLIKGVEDRVAGRPMVESDTRLMMDLLAFRRSITRNRM